MKYMKKPKYLARKSDGSVLKENKDGTFSFIKSGMYKPYKYERGALSNSHFMEITEEDIPKMKERKEKWLKNPNWYLEEIECMGEEYKNQPPKEIRNVLWRAYGYKDFDTVIHNSHGEYTVGDAVYDMWQSIHDIVKNEPEWFMKWVKDHEPDMSRFEI